MPLATPKVNSSISLPMNISQPFNTSPGNNSKTVVRLAKENARLNALLKTTQTKLDLLERFVRFLAVFGMDTEIMERAEQAMWDTSTPMAPHRSGPQASSSCDLAVDRHGYRVKGKVQAPDHISNRDHLTPEQLRVVESIERLCGQFSGTDLGSLEGSNTSVESAATYEADADKTMVEQETPKKIKAPLTFALRPPSAKRNPTKFRQDPDYSQMPVKTRTPLTPRGTPPSRTTPTHKTVLGKSSIQTTPVQRIGRGTPVKRHASPGHFSSNSSTPVQLTPRATTLIPLRRPKSPAIPVQRSLYKPTVSSAMRSVSASQTSKVPRLSSQRRSLHPRKEKENIKKNVVSH
ncbi:uncharacterized protein EV420DRAFT_1547475 [Desarmillaria tabescens]|uniref:Uncharacterized protein n=1 Tax=Armillaria tabescens TaxID=1929756 RepID=A0AA39N550_ARMTA|nr:uncharacterized protein EV420DRAFT_1547475 [Desarmillaria tabescens]KAK0457803.1 hypothetical protein EV420DRAFT_1547475 [Desarmillaria tabescens]